MSFLVVEILLLYVIGFCQWVKLAKNYRLLYTYGMKI